MKGLLKFNGDMMNEYEYNFKFTFEIDKKNKKFVKICYILPNIGIKSILNLLEGV